MSVVFGVANHSPNQLIDSLTHHKVVPSRADVLVLPKKLSLRDRKLRKNVLLVSHAPDFMRNLQFFNSPYAEKLKVFVFASPLTLNGYSGVLPMDYSAHGSTGCTFGQKSLDMSLCFKKFARDPVVVNTPINYMTRLVESVIAGSLLNPLMTFIYTLPSSTHQTPIKSAVSDWLLSGKPVIKLHHFIRESGVQVTQRVFDRLELILTSDSAKVFREALLAYKKTGMNSSKLDSICKPLHVDSYEITYILSVSGKSKK